MLLFFNKNVSSFNTTRMRKQIEAKITFTILYHDRKANSVKRTKQSCRKLDILYTTLQRACIVNKYYYR